MVNDIEFIIKHICSSIDRLKSDHDRYKRISSDTRRYIDYIGGVLCKYIEDQEIDFLMHPLDKIYILLAILFPRTVEYGDSYKKKLVVEPQILALHHIFNYLGSYREEVKARINRLIDYLDSLKSAYGDIIKYIENPIASLVAAMGLHIEEQIQNDTYLGRDMEDGSYVIIKFVEDTRINPEILELFSKKSFDGVPRIRFYQKYGDQYVIVRDHVKGRDLSQYRGRIRDRRGLEELCKLFIEFLKIISRIYGEEHILHHDLHPRNIIVEEKTGKVYVIDWIYADRLKGEPSKYYRGKCIDIYRELYGEEDQVREELYCEIYSIASLFWEIINSEPYTGGTFIKYSSIDFNKVLINILGGSRECIDSILESDNPFRELEDVIEKYMVGPKKHVCFKW